MTDVDPRPPSGSIAIDRLRRLTRRPMGRLARARREGTLSLDGLPPATRFVSIVAVALIALTTAFLVVNVLAEWWPAPVLRIPGQLSASQLPGRASVAPFILGLIAIASAMSALGAAFGAARGPRRRLGLIILGVLGVEIGLALIGVGKLSVVIFPSSDVAPRTLGILSVAAGVALALLPNRFAARPAVAALIAAVPPVSALIVIPLLAGLSGTVPIEAADPKWPDRIEGIALAAGVLAGLITIVAGLVGVLFVWQSVTAARAARREGGAAVAKWMDRRPLLLAGVVGAKVVWLIAGYLALLPAAVAGSATETWSRARSEDILGVVFAIAIAIVIAAWLLRGARPIVSDSGVKGATALMVGGFYLPSFVAGVGLLFLALLNQPPEQYASAVPTEPGLLDCGRVVAAGPSAGSLCIVRVFVGLIEPAGLITFAVASCIVAVLLLRRSHRPLALALVVILLWIAPVALGIAWGLIRHTDPVAIGRPELMTVDAAITVVVAGLAVLWWTGRQRSAGPGALALILISSTLIANAGALVPAGRAGIAIAGILVFGAVYGFIFDSGELNRAGTDRSERVPRALGLQLLGLAFVVVAIAFDSYSVDQASLAGLFVPPVVLILVGAHLSHRHRARAGVRNLPPPLRRGAVAGASGAAALAVLLGLASFVPKVPPLAPSAIGYAAFLEHVDATRADLRLKLAHVRGSEGDPTITAYRAGVAVEQQWLASATAAPCYADEFERWHRSVNAFASIADGLFATDIRDRVTAYQTTDELLDAGRSPCQTVIP